MEIHLPLYHVHGLIARVDVKLAAVFPAPDDEDEGVGFLPKDAHLLSAFGEPARFIEQINDGHGKHGGLLSIVRGTMKCWSIEFSHIRRGYGFLMTHE